MSFDALSDLMFLLSAALKWLRNRGKPRHCWLPLLPTELRIELLLTIGAQHNAIDSVMMLAREFPEFGELVLVLHWTGDSLLDVAKTNIKVLSLADDVYALFPKKQSNDRPVKIIIKELTNMYQRVPSFKLDGSTSCLLNRFVDSHTMVKLQTQSVHSSLLLFNHTPAPLVQCIVESNQHPLSSLNLDYNKLQAHAERCHSGEGLQIDPYFMLTPTLSQDMLDMTYWRLSSPYYTDSSCRLKSFVAYNCPMVFNINFGYGVNVVEIRFSPRKDHSATQQLLPHAVCTYNTPTQVLHVSFDFCLLPLFKEYHNVVAGAAELFTLQNENWSYTNPYGLSAYLSDYLTFPDGEMDQATYNREMGPRIEEYLDGHPYLKLPLLSYKNVKLYGVPDTTVIWNSFDHVVSFKWWRLTPRVVDEDERPAPIIRCPSLNVLHIVSVIKRNERRLLFQAPLLRELVLISLHDSDVPWSIEDTLFGETPHLVEAYLERRTDPSRDLAPPMAITSHELKNLTPVVKGLHVRGYIPDVFMVGHNLPQYIYQHISGIMLDVSEIARKPNESFGTEKASTYVTLAFEQQDFPALEWLGLMSTKENYLSGELSNINMRVVVGGSCTCVFISDCVNPLSITLNGQTLVRDESQCYCYINKGISQVETRDGRSWVSEVGSNLFHLGGKSQAFSDDWLFGIKEY